MNGKDLLVGMSFIEGKYVAEAENGTLGEETRKKPVRRTWKRAPLIAAIIAMMLLLVGCAVVYVLSMQDLKVGQQEVSYDAFDPDTLEYLGKETYTEQVYTIAGLQGTPTYQAAQEWFDFAQSYDQDMAILGSVWHNMPQYPAEYDGYYLYSQEMKDKIDEIVQKYGLKYVGAELEFRTLKNMLAALDIQRIQTADNEVTVSVNSGSCWENGNFKLELALDLPEDADSDFSTTMGILRWNRKDCFSTNVIAFEDTGDWQEWNYTTSSGNDVLIVRSPSHERAYIICNREEAILSLEVEAKQEVLNNVDGKSWADEGFLSDAQLERIADAVDFGIQPRVATQEDVADQPAASASATQNGYTVALKSVETDGYVARIVLGITAPEGTVISRDPNTGETPYFIYPNNFDDFTPAEGRTVSGGGGWNPQEDGDGLDNTQDLVMEAYATMEDGSAPFSPGTVWNIRFEDLMCGAYHGSPSSELLAEGEWNFAITFGEDNGDYRELELLSDPITAKACTGWKADGTDVLEEFTVTSFKLRKFSSGMTWNLIDDYYGEKDFGSSADFYIWTGNFTYAVMKDGTKIQLTGSGNSEPVDLDQVDYVLLADGTKLDVPE